ncbi:16079_t:CDS:2 [Entrophospora sp. SA101]|nr:16079_t:CDS:2 [Entrophospora sp. SA101]
MVGEVQRRHNIKINTGLLRFFSGRERTCLTVTEFDISASWFKVGLSPETLRRTNLGELKVENVIMPTKKIGDKVNLEVDMLGKYVEKLIESKLFSSINSSSSNENGENYIERIVKKYLDEKFK